MGGIASVDLTPVANFQTQFTAFVFVLTLCTCRRNWLSSLVAPAGVLFYALVVRIGGNIQNPLNDFIGTDLEQANTYLNIVYPCLAFGFSQLAWAWFRLLRSEQWMAFHAKTPNLVRPHTQQVLVRTASDTYEIREEAVPSKHSAPKAHWGLRVTSPSWFYLLLTFVYVFGAIAGSQVVWDQYIPRTASNSMSIAFWVNLIIPLGVGLIYLLIVRSYPDAWTFGPSRDLLLSSKYNVDDALARTMQSETRIRVRTQIGAEIVLHLINTLAITGARLLWTNINNNFYAALGLFALHLILLTLVYAASRLYPMSMRGFVTGTPVDDSGDYYTNLVSHLPLSSAVTDDNVRQRQSKKATTAVGQTDAIAGYFAIDDHEL